MILLYVLPSLLAFCYGQNAALSITCGDTEDSLTFTAVYSGLGTPGSVIWTYSGASLTVDTSGCSVFGTVPAVFPAKMSFKCGNIDASLPTDTYQLTVSSLNNTDYGKTWAVTFTPPTGAAPPPVPSVAPSDCSTTTTTTSSTTTTTTSTTTTMSSTTTTTSTTTTIMPSSTTTLTTSTTTMPTTTTTPGRPSTASMPSSTSSTPTTTSISSSKSPSITTVGTTSDDGLSDEMILVIILVPVGVLVVVGIVTFFCIFHHLRRSRRLSENHKSHRKGKHYKVNMRPLHQHQHTAKTAYGRHQAGEYNHKHQKGSKILHHEGHRHDLSNDNFYGNGVKQNPVYQGRNISRSYYSGSVPMYDYYRSQVTKGHVYPSHISEYQ